MEFKKESAKSCTWGGPTPCTSIYRRIHSAGVYTLLEGSLSEKTLWVLMGTKVSTRQQCVLAAKKANGVPSGIRQRAACWLREVIPLFYSALVRPCLECCVLFWSPQHKRDVEYCTESDTGPQTYFRESSTPPRRKAGTVAWRRDGSGTISHTWKEGAKRAEPGSFQWCQFHWIYHGRSRVWISFLALLTFIEFRRIRTRECFLPRCKGIVPDALWSTSVPPRGPERAFQLWHIPAHPGEEQMALLFLESSYPVWPPWKHSCSASGS